MFVAGLSADCWQEILEVTADLEATAARYAASRMSADERGELLALHLNMLPAVESCSDKEFDRQNVRLHELIWIGGKNRTLRESIQRMRSRSLPYTRLEFMVQKTKARWSYFEHDAVVRAVMEGNAELAHHAMRAHVMRAGQQEEDLLRVKVVAETR